MTTQQTITPSGDISTGGWFTAPIWSKVADASDATSVGGSPGATLEMHMSDVSIGNGWVAFARGNARIADSVENVYYDLYIRVGTGGWLYLGQASKPGGVGNTTVTLGWTPVILTDADTDLLRMGINYISGDGPLIEANVEVISYAQPTVSVTYPTGIITAPGGGAPNVQWTFTGDTLGQAWYQVIVYSAAQYGAGGFTPGGGPYAWYSGVVSSAANYAYLTSELPDGSYRAYVAAAQNIHGGAHWSAWQFSSFSIDRYPNLPVLQAPATGSKLNIGGLGFTTQWQYSHPDVTQPTQAAYALRRKSGAGGTYNYWRQSDLTWQATIQWNTSAVTSKAWTAGQWPNGVVYYWSVNTRDADGDESGFATDLTIEGDSPPTVNVSAPTGTVISTTSPNISWAFSDPESDPQAQYEAKVFTAAQYGVAGFSPDSSPATWSSGAIASSLSTITAPNVPILENFTTYRVYVRAYADGQWSAWDYEQFTITLDAQNTPHIVVLGQQEALGQNAIQIYGHDNILPEYMASFEDSSGAGWWTPTGCTLATVTTDAAHGSASLELTSTAGGTISIQAAGGHSVSPGLLHTARANFRANSVGRTVELNIIWLDAASATISTSTSTHTDVTGAYQEKSIQATSPGTAAFMKLQCRILATATSEKHRIDKLSFAPGTTAQAPWSRGGISFTGVDVEVRDSSSGIWTPLRAGYNLDWEDVGGQFLQITDVEFIPRVAREYRARVNGFIGSGSYISSAWSPTGTTTWTAPLQWWLANPVAKTSVKVKVKAPLSMKQPITAGVFYPEGSQRAVVVSDGVVRGVEFDLSVWVKNATEEATAQAYLVPGRTVMLKDPIGKAWYVQIVSEVNKDFYTAHTLTVRKNIYLLNYRCVEVNKPAVP